MSDEVFYFAFGSNLLAERLCQGSCPSVSFPESFHTVGKVPGWELAFTGLSNSWKGATATIEKRGNAVVYGAVWRIPKSDLEILDKQEGVHRGVYSRVKSPDDLLILDCEDQPIDCYTYIKNGAQVGKPSPQYKHVIVSGGEQIALPNEYISNVLRKIEDNENSLPVSIRLSVLPDGLVPE